jgi:hypothetical protein
MRYISSTGRFEMCRLPFAACCFARKQMCVFSARYVRTMFEGGALHRNYNQTNQSNQAVTGSTCPTITTNTKQRVHQILSFHGKTRYGISTCSPPCPRRFLLGAPGILLLGLLSGVVYPFSRFSRGWVAGSFIA